MDSRRRRAKVLVFIIAAFAMGTIIGISLITSAARVTMEMNGTTFELNDTNGLWINGTVNITGVATYNGSTICTPDNGLCTNAEADPVWIAASGNYLTTASAAATYQPIGSYLTSETDPLWAGNSTNICYANGTGCPEATIPYQSSAAGWTNTSTNTSTLLDVWSAGNITANNTLMASRNISSGTVFIRAFNTQNNRAASFGWDVSNDALVIKRDSGSCTSNRGIWFYPDGVNVGMNMKCDGNVGIGTASPTTKLDVNGSVNVTGGNITITSPNAALSVNSGAGTNYIYLRDGTISKASGSLFSIPGINAGGGNAAVVSLSFGTINTGFFGSSNNISFSNAGNETARMTTTGFGIGTVTPNQRLTVNGSINISNTIYVGNETVCLSNGTNCPAMSIGAESDPLWTGNYTAQTIMLGNNALAESFGISIGDSTTGKTGSISIGNSADATSPYAITIGASSEAGASNTDTDAIAIGRSTYAAKNYSIAIGYGASTNKNNCIALGLNAYCNNENTASFGHTTSKMNLNVTGNLTIQGNIVIGGTNNIVIPYQESAAGLTNTTANITTDKRIISNNSIYTYSSAEVLSTQTYYCDFMILSSTTTCQPNYLGVAIASGTIVGGTGNITRPGVLILQDATGANSGYGFVSYGNAFRLNGSEEFKAIVAFEQALVSNDTRTVAGFIDTASAASQVDGVYFNIQNQTAWCQSTSNSANTSVSSTNYTINWSVNAFNNVSADWYGLKVKIGDNGTWANCAIYNFTSRTATGQVDGRLLWEANITGIPNTAGRETGSGIVSITRTAGTATNIAYVDSIMTEIERYTRPIW